MYRFETHHTKHVQSILIVDDNEVILNLLEKGFRMYDVDVHTAESNRDGLNLFNSTHTDTVLADIRVPGDLDGIELVHRIRNKSPQTTIAVMTGDDTKIAAELYSKGIVDHFFAKPFAISYVCKCLTTEPEIACLAT